MTPMEQWYAEQEARASAAFARIPDARTDVDLVWWTDVGTAVITLRHRPTGLVTGGAGLCRYMPAVFADAAEKLAAKYEQKMQPPAAG